MFDIAKMNVQNSQDAIVEQYTRNEEGMLAMSDEDRKIA